jgi:hypothetical protein
VPEANSPVLVALNLPGEASRWEALGFLVSSRAFDVGAVALSVGHAGPSWQFDGGDVAVSQIRSIPLARRTDHREAAAASTQPNGAWKVDHVVVASDCPAATRAELEQVGFVARGERVVDVPSGPRSQSFFWSGEVLLELVGPADVEPQGLAAARIWGVTFVVDDFEALMGLSRGLISPPRAAVQPGRQIATVRAAAQIGIELAFMTPHVKQQDG